MAVAKVSIVTVVFNGRDDLLRTIESIRNQDFKDIEYVVVDGGSTDGTCEIIGRNLDLIDSWVSEADLGIYDAMNKGWRMATGEYVIFMNAGDSFHKEDTLSSVSVFLKDADVIYGGCHIHGSRKSDGLYYGKPIEYLVNGMVCSHQSMFFRRSLIEQRGYSLSFGTAGDFELICSLISSGCHFKKVEVVVSNYHAGGVSDVRRLSSIRNSVRALKVHGLYGLYGRFYWAVRFFSEISKLIVIKGFNVFQK